MNSNGVLSFGDRFTDCCSRYFPNPSSPPLIAPFYHDIHPGNGGGIFYTLTSDPTLLFRLSTIFQESVNTSFNATYLFIATWERVARFGDSSGSSRNTFQVVLATDGYQSYVLFLYGDIQWGDRALIGFNAGRDQIGSYILPSSLTPDVVNVNQQSNVGIPGIFLFRVDGKCVGVYLYIEVTLQCNLSKRHFIQRSCTNVEQDKASV